MLWDDLFQIYWFFFDVSVHIWFLVTWLMLVRIENYLLLEVLQTKGIILTTDKNICLFYIV